MIHAEKRERLEWARTKGSYGSETIADEVRESH